MRPSVRLSLMVMLAVTLGRPIAAQSWPSIAQRQASLNARIDNSMRQGMLMRRTADKIRADLAALLQREADYKMSAPGLTLAERADLDRRYAALIERVPLIDTSALAQAHPIPQ